MNTIEELKKWVTALSPAEKRFIKLQGKARAGTGSQLLELFDWLNQSGETEDIPDLPFRKNVPTLAIRLRELMLESLQILQKDENVDAVLMAVMNEARILQSKKLGHVAARQLRKAMKLAAETSRYSFMLQLLELEYRQLQVLPPGQMQSELQRLKKEQDAALEKLRILGELRLIHDQLLALARQFPFSRNPSIIAEMNTLAAAPVVAQNLHSSNYLEQGLAVSVMGIYDLFNRRPEPAVIRYRTLLVQWKLHPLWQADQSALLMTLCKYYQNACFFSPVELGKANTDLSFLHGFEGLKQEDHTRLNEMLYHHQFMLALNTGQLDRIKPLMTEIDQWMGREMEGLNDALRLPFLCNFAVAEFLKGDYASANKFLTRILNTPDRSVRTDIRDFALTLQPILHFELDRTELSEYLARSGKRKFGKSGSVLNFELLVFRNIGLLMQCDNDGERKSIFSRMMDELSRLSDSLPGDLPLLGLNEIYMWAEARKNHQSIREVFLEAVRKNLEALEKAEKII